MGVPNDTERLQIAELFAEARALHQAGRPDAAKNVYLRITALDPAHVETLNMLGVLSGQSRDFISAVGYFDRAIAVAPDNPSAYCNRGLAQQELQQWQASLESFDRALRLSPDDPVSRYGRGNVRGTLGRFDEALEDYGHAVSINPGFFQAHANRAALLHQTKQFEQALAAYGRALELRPDHALLWVHRGNLHMELRRMDAALADYDRAVAIDANFAEAYSNRGIVLREIGQIEAALHSYDRAIALKPDYAEAYVNRAAVHKTMKNLEAVVADFDAALALDASLKYLRGARLEAKLHICDWRGFSSDLARIEAGLEAGEPVCNPFAYLTFCDSPRLQRRTAEIWVREECPADDSHGALGERPRTHGRIRVGYFSADFREHPTSRLMAELIENHDRSRFEIIGFSFGEDTRDELRKRLERSFDRFLDVRDDSSHAITALARQLELDIAVDLGGYTHSSRPGIFAMRAAPLQVNYLGYPGTMGAPYIDYVVADSVLVPPERAHYFVEKILFLPNSYQVNDRKRRLSAHRFTREELGLPSRGVIFCCFNNNFKITPATFAIWMRILKRVPGSVLWLLEDNPAAAARLRQEAAAAQVEPARLLFAQRLSAADHLTRHRVADLFLDTHPYNAHTTASDALWVGLPVLTWPGESFSSRVAASLLRALDLPQLIASSREHYEALAVDFASNPDRLAAVTSKLRENRLSRPLFDTPLFTRHLESGFARIHARRLAGLAPEHIHVEAT